MKKRKWNRVLSIFLVMVTVISLMSGCDRKSAKNEEKDTITVYLWSTNLYEKYAPYIQKQLPDINIEFVVGNNDLDFYRFLKENGGLPDIITCCRFSLHDANPLKDSLMDLSTTNEAGAVYNTYLNNFMNQDGSVNWLPVCADAHGFVVNKDLFKKYHIPLPTDYKSFVSAWKHCRDYLHQSCLQRLDVNGVLSIVTLIIQRERVWTVKSGRRLLNVWSNSFRIQG